jgi:hypothetical protein
MTETTGACTAEGCETRRRSAASAYCEKHYYRLRRRGTLEARSWHKRGGCSVEGCTDPERHDGVCIKHWTRLRRHGDANTVLPQGCFLTGDQSPGWAGDAITYAGMHHRVRATLGLAKLLACADCGAPARHWSYDRTDPNEKQSELGPYSTDLAHYEPRCVPCHKRFDLDAIREGRPDHDSPHRRAGQNDGPA